MMIDFLAWCVKRAQAQDMQKVGRYLCGRSHVSTSYNLWKAISHFTTSQTLVVEFEELLRRAAPDNRLVNDDAFITITSPFVGAFTPVSPLLRTSKLTATVLQGGYVLTSGVPIALLPWEPVELNLQTTAHLSNLELSLTLFAHWGDSTPTWRKYVRS